MDPCTVISAIILLVGFLIAVFAAAEKDIQSKKVRESNLRISLGHLPHFDATQQSEIYNDAGIVIDDNRKKICLVTFDVDEPTLRVFNYSDLLSSEIFEDGETITKTNRTSQVAGAVLGGLVLGGAGAVIGGLSGKKKTYGKVHAIELRLILNDMTNPRYHINFLGLQTQKRSTSYNQAQEKALHWHGIMTVVINQADKLRSAGSTSDADF